MRSVMLTGAIALGLALAGCGGYNTVNQGSGGPTSPEESGQTGAYGDQAPPYGSAKQEKSDDWYRTHWYEITNGETDPTMEGSGNIAAQGNYASAAEQRRPGY